MLSLLKLISGSGPGVYAVNDDAYVRSRNGFEANECARYLDSDVDFLLRCAAACPRENRWNPKKRD